MSRYLLIALALAAGFASSELAAEVPRTLGGYDDDYSGKGGMGGMMSGGKGGKGGKGYDDDYKEPKPEYPEPEPCVCVEVCDDDYSDSGKGGMMMGGKGSRELMGKGGKGYSDDYEPSCHEECTGVCYPTGPELECCEYASVCEESGKGGMMSGGMMSGGKGERELSMGKGGKGYEEVCEDVCVKYCPPTYIFNPGYGECFDTGSYTTPSGCGCDCECCLDEPDYEDDEYGKGKGKGGMMSGGMMSGGKGGKGGKGERQLMMGMGGMMSGKESEPEPSFTCACGCACDVPEPSPSGKGGMMGGGMMSGGMMSGGMMSGGKGSDSGGKGSDSEGKGGKGSEGDDSYRL